MVVFGIDEAGKGPVLGSMIAASAIEPSWIDSPAHTNASTVAAHAEAAADVVCDGLEGIRDAGDVDAVRFARRVARAPA